MGRFSIYKRKLSE